MSRELRLRLEDGQMERLSRLARRLDRTPGEMAACLVEEALRMGEFPYIEFRDSPLGRQAYIKGHRLTVWMLVWLARAYDYDPARTAEHLRWPIWLVEAGFVYYRAFTAEIDPAIAEQDASNLDTLRQLLPNIQVFTANLGDEADPIAATDASPVRAG